jgi:hypothetical protein
MTLSTTAINILAETIAPKAAEALLMSEEWVTLCQDLVPSIVDAELGEMDPDLYFDISLAVMDHLTIKVVKNLTIKAV